MVDVEEPAHPPPGFVIEVVIAGLVVFVLAIAISAVTGAKSGTFAEWVGGLSTLAAFIAAVFAGWYAHRALKVEQGRDAERIKLEHRSQAVLIAAWHDSARKDIPALGGALTGTFGTYESHGLMLRNASDLPVVDVQILIFIGPARLGSRVMRVLPPAQEARFEPFAGRVKENWSAYTGYMTPEELPTAELAWTFVDTSGTRWERARDNTLRDITNAQAKEMWIMSPERAKPWTG